jgi:hypothetical protein
MLCTVLLFIGGCYRDTPDQDLQKPVFINDVNNPGLPIASDLGYNTFGAYYNSKIWVSPKNQNNISSDAEFIVGTFNDSTVIHFKGNDYTNQPLEIDFLITKNVIVSDDDLVIFGKRSFNLKGDSVKIRIGSTVINAQSGSINFSSVRSLILDKKKMGTIISGTFEMTGILNGNKVELENGRFDLLVPSLPHFYNYIGQW